jgi:hypothetical protein
MADGITKMSGSSETEFNGKRTLVTGAVRNTTLSARKR